MQSTIQIVELQPKKQTKKRVTVYTVRKQNPLPEPNPHGLYYAPSCVKWTANKDEAENCARSFENEGCRRLPNKVEIK